MVKLEQINNKLFLKRTDGKLLPIEILEELTGGRFCPKYDSVVCGYDYEARIDFGWPVLRETSKYIFLLNHPP